MQHHHHNAVMALLIVLFWGVILFTFIAALALGAH